MTLTKYPRLAALGIASAPGAPEPRAAPQVRSRKVARWVDLELPPTESTSWWRLDGYSTDAEQEGDKEQDEEDEEDEVLEQDEAMAVSRRRR